MVSHVSFKFKMEPEVRRADYEERLEEDWAKPFGENWDLVLKDCWMKQLEVFKTAVQSLSHERKFERGRISINQLVVNHLSYKEIEPVFMEQPKVTIKELEVSGDIPTEFFEKAIEHCDRLVVQESTIGKDGD